MRPYEVMVIFDATVDPAAIQAVVDRTLETMRAGGANPGAVERWGRRPFAYEVKHRREGYYVLIDFSGEVQVVRDVERMLTLADEVLRHKIIRLPERGAGARASRQGREPAPAPVEAVGPRASGGSDADR
ncbi:MAG: 30S ribosomal protein S6 [Acidimicrobiales bacterium]